mmetsp:Transcript_6881/g.8836  ORF Transcript_6881/g.8836 Transcript_6881/m.8836 type:complete len:191 (-) Transcript_6881:242-814(-)
MSDDYFSHHSHLRLYLYREHSIYFEDLTSKQTHKYFESFCKEYNMGGILSESYYRMNLPQDALDQCKRTKHAWKFRTNSVEEKSLALVKEGVKKQTDYSIIPPTAAVTCLPVNTEQQQRSRKESVDVNRRSRDRQEEGSRQRQRQQYDKDSNDDDGKMKRQKQQEELLKRLNLDKHVKLGQKITIAPRQD